MKTLRCRDLGGNDEFIARARSNTQVKRIMMRHMRQEHTEIMQTMTPDEAERMVELMDRILDGQGMKKKRSKKI